MKQAKFITVDNQKINLQAEIHFGFYQIFKLGF